MIIKGGSRAAPEQLARHLQRTDTNEHIKVLELQSPTGDLKEALRDWQFLATGTRGSKGLYHANIDPDARYTMTPEQWQRAVDVLEKELGFQGQPRVVVLHEKHGRQHIHVVWQRTDTDTMTLRSDSWNYLAHEQASLRLEREFGHEVVPGKHAKRDREKSPEFPKSEINHAEWQQSERTGVDPRDRKEAITRLFEQSDNGTALKAALEQDGYVLAQGNRRDFVIIDSQGEIYSLGRQIKGVKAKDLREFMADIDREKLPTVDEATEQAKSLQRQPTPEQASSGQTIPTPPEAKPAEQAAIEKALGTRHAAEGDKLRAAQEQERKQTAAVIEQDINDKIEHLDAAQQAARDRYLRENDKRGIDAVLATLKEYVLPVKAAEEALRQQEKDEAFLNRLETERNDYIERLNSDKADELAALDERHAQQLREHDARLDEDLARHMREEENAQRLLMEMENHGQQIDGGRARDGPDDPQRAR